MASQKRRVGFGVTNDLVSEKKRLKKDVVLISNNQETMKEKRETIFYYNNISLSQLVLLWRPRLTGDHELAHCVGASSRIE